MSEILFKIAYMLPGFLMAIVFHEFAHAWMANKFGDSTAKRMGRLTLNPAAHYDLMGTIIFPLIGVVAGFAAIGWAKPVPIDTRNFKSNKNGIFWVSFAGPLANIILGFFSAVMFALIATKLGDDFSLKKEFLFIFRYSILINFVLAAFNLIPLPPLDGSRMLSSLLSPKAAQKYEEIGRYTPMIFIVAMMLSFQGIPTFHYFISPMTQIGEYITRYFLFLFSGQV